MNSVNLVSSSIANVAIASGGGGFPNGQRTHCGDHGGRGGRCSRSKPTCQVGGRQGRTGIQCFYRLIDLTMVKIEEARSSSQEISAYIATPSTLEDLDWYMDSGATNHITHHEDPGTSKSSILSVGNGDKLPIIRSTPATFSKFFKEFIS